MKIATTFFAIFLFLSIGLSFAQLSQEEKQKLIDSLDSRNPRENRKARILVEDYKIVEAIPKLEFKARNGDCTGIYLRLLQELGSNNVPTLVQIALDSSAKCYDPIQTRYDCSKILIELGDYSTAQYVIDYYNAKASKFLFDPGLLPKILENRPDLESQAKAILFDYASNFRGDPFFRYIANAIIADKYPSEAAPIIANSLRNEPTDATRILSLWLLFEINYDGLEEIMRERIINEPVASYRFTIADSLLKEFSTPQNYEFIKEYVTNEPDDVTKSLIENEIEKFIPGQPDSSESILDMIDYLIGLNDTLYNFDWLKDESFKIELQSNLLSSKTKLQNGDSLACAKNIKSFQDKVDFEYTDSINTTPQFVTSEGWKFLYYNAQYILDRLPEIPLETEISTYSLFATNSLWLELGSKVLSGSVGVNNGGTPPFLDSQVELSVGVSTSASGYSIKGNRIKVKQNARINGDIYYNQLDNKGTITGQMHTPLELPLVASLPEFKLSTPGTQNVTVPINGEQVLQPGSYGNIQVKMNGKLIFTGGEYHINNITIGVNTKIIFQSPAEIMIANKFESGQGTYIGPEDTITMSAKEIIFYISGINGTTGTLGTLPKAARIGIGNMVKANFYVPNGSLWIMLNSDAEGAFIGKDISVGVGVDVYLKSAF